MGRPPKPGGPTQQHNVRVPKGLWDECLALATAEGTTVTAWINEDLAKRVRAAKRRRERTTTAGDAHA